MTIKQIRSNQAAVWPAEARRGGCRGRVFRCNLAYSCSWQLAAVLTVHKPAIPNPTTTISTQTNPAFGARSVLFKNPGFAAMHLSGLQRLAGAGAGAGC